MMLWASMEWLHPEAGVGGVVSTARGVGQDTWIGTSVGQGPGTNWLMSK